VQQLEAVQAAAQQAIRTKEEVYQLGTTAIRTKEEVYQLGTTADHQNKGGSVSAGYDCRSSS
jgi:hypothetical protein